MINQQIRFSTRTGPITKAPMGVVCLSASWLGAYQRDAVLRGRRP